MRIVVVGGVAAGMSAAARARRLDEDAEIIVLEKGPHVSFANCGLPYYVGGEITDPDKLLVQTPQKLRDALNLDVRVNTEVTGLDPSAKKVTLVSDEGTSQLDYDALILAPGARAVTPALPGIDSPRVRHLRSVQDALDLREKVEEGARHAVVLGAGFIGLEAAEALRGQGLEVTVVELASHVLPPLEPELAILIKKELERLGIRVRDGVGATEIESGEDSDTVILSDGTRIDADIVVLSVGVRPATEVFEGAGIECVQGAIVVDQHGRTSQEGVWAGGDATASRDAVTGVVRPVPLAGPANRAGRLIADSILLGEAARPIPNPVGTAVVRVGDLTAAMTGANKAALEQAAIPFHTLNLHPNQHAGYFPGARQMHLIVLFDAGSGAVLGAQAVGSDGVDKRIDVLATAIRAGMTVSDLIDLDLAYAPPYGSAKDPVNMAGMVGENVMDGVTQLWYAQELPQVMDEALILDVRTPAEFATGHLPGALNIPHTELRERMEEVHAAAGDRPVRVHCQSGVRSYLAERALRAEGFDVKNLSGGMLTLREAIDAGLLPGVELVAEG